MAFLNTKSNRQPTTAAAAFLPTGKTANISPTALGLSQFLIFPGWLLFIRGSQKRAHIRIWPHKDHPANLGPHVFEASKFLIHCPYFLTSQCQRESPPSPGCSANGWTASHRPARPAQLPDGRKCLAQNQLQKHQLFNG